MPTEVLSLIANSGIQFHQTEARFDAALFRQQRIRFIERFDARRSKYWIEEVVQLPGDGEQWCLRSDLEAFGWISPSGKISSEVKLQDLKLIAEDGFFEISNFNQVARHFERKWIPLPYFKRNNINADFFGPTDWVRIYFERGEGDIIRLALAADTTTSTDEAQVIAPVLSENPNENVFAIPADDRLIFGFFDNLQGCDWVNEFLMNLYYKADSEQERPFLKPLAGYIFLLRSLRASGILPQIQLLSDRSGHVEVDMVIDVGNSNTCALLFESPLGQHFDFNYVKRLELQDFDNPVISHQKSFSTRLVFTESDFGKSLMPLNLNNRFNWPSPARIGFEAERIINDSTVELRLQREVRTYNSSPKRYLWDDQRSDHEWEFHVNDPTLPPKPVYLHGISEQLSSDGSLCKDGVFGSRAMFSRKSLMMFVFLELFSQAHRFINSPGFRSQHGNPSMKRRIRRVLISCPTAMIRSEQIALRQSAADATVLLNNFRKVLGLPEGAGLPYDENLEVIPSVRDLGYDLDNLDKRKDWIYDESTCSQFVVLYGLIARKFRGNADLLFSNYGRVRGAQSDRKSLMVGSLDIGGGTSDLMICRYDGLGSDSITLTPEPLFWESFNLAGDDLLKEIIQQIIIEGAPGNESEADCTGIIENHGRKAGIRDITQLVNGFFGKDNNNIDYKGRLMRVNFLNQVGIPVALRYMSHANTNADELIDFRQMFGEHPPNPELMKYFEAHFGFSIMDLKWKLSSRKVASVINGVFGKLVQQISAVLSAYGCDMVVLSGRPFSFNALEDLFVKYYPVAPHRLINLNKYLIGRWYPFSDSEGYIEDPKTVVCTGALIALMSGRLLKLDSFRLDAGHLKTRLISTANYIGRIDQESIRGVTLTPKVSEGSIQAYELPVQLGFRNLNSDQYPVRHLLSVDVNGERVSATGQPKEGADVRSVREEAEQIRQRMRGRMPLKFVIGREFELDKERLFITEVTDASDQEVPKSYFTLRTKTITGLRGYWLDTGEFTLGIRN